MRMKNILFFTVVAMPFCTLTAPYVLKNESRVKKSIIYSQYAYSTIDDKVANDSSISSVTNITEVSETGVVKEYFANVTPKTKAPLITFDPSIFSPKFNNCVYNGTVLPFNSSEFQTFTNGSAYVPMYKLMFDRSDHFIRDGLLLVCPDIYDPHMPSKTESKFSFAIKTVSFVCVCISSACLILHIIVFILVKKIRNLPGYCLLSLCVALLLAYLFGLIDIEINDHTYCTVIGMIMLYFLLAAFFWMNTISYDVWRSIRMATSKLRLAADRPIMLSFARYSVYAWSMPLMIIVISIIVHYTSSDKKYTLIFDMDTCWFYYKQALLVYFGIPLFSVLGINVIFFISSFYMISMASISRSETASHTGSDLWTRLLLSLKLCSVMGFTWILGIIASAAEAMWLWYFYAACNALQGAFIFFSFTLGERTRKECKKAWQGRKFSLAPTQTTTQNTASSTQ